MKRTNQGNNVIPACLESFPHLSLSDLIGQSRKKDWIPRLNRGMTDRTR